MAPFFIYNAGGLKISKSRKSRISRLIKMIGYVSETIRSFPNPKKLLYILKDMRDRNLLYVEDEIKLVALKHSRKLNYSEFVIKYKLTNIKHRISTTSLKLIDKRLSLAIKRYTHEIRQMLEVLDYSQKDIVFYKKHFVVSPKLNEELKSYLDESEER